MNIIMYMYNWEQQKIYIVLLSMVVKYRIANYLLYGKWTSAHDIQPNAGVHQLLEMSLAFETL